jgi:hypothetical protein
MIGQGLRFEAGRVLQELASGVVAIVGLASMIASHVIGLAIPSNSVEQFVRQATIAQRAG